MDDVMKRARLVSDISAKEMAEILHISRPTLASYEEDVTRMRFGDILRVFSEVNNLGKDLILIQVMEFFSQYDEQIT